MMAVKPRERVAQKVPSSIEVLKRAIGSAGMGMMVDAALLVTLMSFAMRERVCTMAQTKASRNRKVIPNARMVSTRPR